MSCRSRCTVNGPPAARRGRAPPDARGFPAREVRPHRHPPRLRARCVRRVHGARSTVRRCGPCLIFAVQVDGQEVTTVEGIAAEDGELSPVQVRAAGVSRVAMWLLHTGVSSRRSPRCCATTRSPPDEEIREGLSGNFCRCTGYQGIVNAVHRAAQTM